MVRPNRSIEHNSSRRDACRRCVLPNKTGRHPAGRAGSFILMGSETLSNIICVDILSACERTQPLHWPLSLGIVRYSMPHHTS
eukprot:scaffold636736_cov19-Prasinocladus_malaysianus.AAC.1